MSYKLSKSVSYTILLITVFSVVIVGANLIGYDYKNFNQNLEKQKIEYIKNEKQKIKDEVDRVISLIDYSHSLRYDRINELLKQRVEEADAIATSIYYKYKDTKSKDEIIDIIKNSLREIRFFDNFGYYFMFDLEAKLIVHGLKPEFEGTYKFRDFTDLNGKKVIQEIINIAKTKNEGFLDWTFARPDKPNIQGEKHGYVKLIKPLNFVVGTADYIYRVENELKEETLKRIRNISYENDGYVFVLDKDGKTLVNKKYQENEGKDANELNNQKVKTAIAKIVEKSKKDSSGFIEYKLSNNSSEEVLDKLTYITTYEKWGLIIGTGRYLNELNQLMDDKHDELIKIIEEEIFYIVLVFNFCSSWDIFIK